MVPRADALCEDLVQLWLSGMACPSLLQSLSANVSSQGSSLHASAAAMDSDSMEDKPIIPRSRNGTIMHKNRN